MEGRTIEVLVSNHSRNARLAGSTAALGCALFGIRGLASQALYHACVFSELYDAISVLWSWRWPEVMGEITAVDVERVKSAFGDAKRLRLAVAYKFTLGEDGPYTGESFWNPAFSPDRRVLKARKKIRVHNQVTVRYRPDDPGVNVLDRRTWRNLE